MTHAEKVNECIIYQTDPRLPYKCNRYGCRVFTLIAIPQFIAGECLTVPQILELVDRGEKVDGVIVNENMKAGKNENLLIDWAFDTLKCPRHGRQIGWKREHITTREWQYMIGRWATDGADGHYTLFDRAQKEIYDPHNPHQAGYEINKKEITRRLLYATWEN